jgi:hypothetical protein
MKPLATKKRNKAKPRLEKKVVIFFFPAVERPRQIYIA